jgi:hypothetical protein
MSVAGGAMFTALTLVLLSLLYLFFGFALLNKIRFRKLFKKEAYKGISLISIIFAFLVGNFLSTAVLGVLFELLSWEGTRSILGTAIACMATAPLLVLIEYLVTRSDLYKSALPRILIWGGLTLFLFLLY